MKTPYIEADCTIEHEGKQFGAGGAYITPDYAIGYMSDDMQQIITWHGKVMGSARVVSSWPMPLNCWLTNRYYQVEATINGIRYTGRTAGDGTIWKGKRKAKQ